MCIRDRNEREKTDSQHRERDGGECARRQAFVQKDSRQQRDGGGNAGHHDASRNCARLPLPATATGQGASAQLAAAIEAAESDGAEEDAAAAEVAAGDAAADADTRCV